MAFWHHHSPMVDVRNKACRRLNVNLRTIEIVFNFPRDL